MSLPTIQKHYLRILRLWPRDRTRNITFDLSLSKRLENRFLKSASQPESNRSSTTTNTAQVHAVTSTVNARVEMKELNAMYSLLENRYSKQYPVSTKMLRPIFNPMYYQDLAKELEEAPNRTWLQKKWMRWSNLVRFT